ncbi:Mechanosensory protein 2 [Lamellibrachia satsuma]|nr:Mechanosensory protein 2 [Lamellibrachia satsuma]
MVEDNKSREKEKTVDQKKKDERRQSMQQKRGKRVSGEGLPGGKTVKVDDRRERGHSVRQERNFADVVSQGKAKKARVFMGDSIIRKVDKIVNRGDDITVCLPGAKIEDIAEKAGQVMGGGTGGAVLVHVGTNNAEKEGTSAIVGKYRRLIKTLKEARVGQIVLSGILPIMGGRGEEYRNCRRMAINTQVQKVCMEEGVGFVDMWLNFVGRDDFFMRDGLHLTGKGAAVLGCEFVRVVDKGTGKHGIGFCGCILMGLSFVLIVVTFPFSLCLCFKVVQEYERAVIFRLGRLVSGGAKGPGLFFIIPCMDAYTKVDLRTITFDVPPQEILSKDSVTVAVDAVVYYRIKNATVSVTNVEDANRSTRLLAATTLRNVLGTKNLSEILSDREHISNFMQETLADATDQWGVKVERVEIKDVRLPIQLQRAMAAEAEATREARAKVIAAEGEKSASPALKDAADIMSLAPGSIQLRYLQTVNTICAEKNSTIIFPIPMNLLSAFGSASRAVSAPPVVTAPPAVTAPSATMAPPVVAVPSDVTAPTEVTAPPLVMDVEQHKPGMADDHEE